MFKTFNNFKEDCAEAFGITKSDFNRLGCMYLDLNTNKKSTDTKIEKVEFVEEIYNIFKTNLTNRSL